ncbi:MAG: DNA cytosine methyltransferase [Planctomycetota bacterium]|nr:DNA cytosine methyltransferase [Planctomycetota bacterium]MDI6787152.1 DNA cytosine methyltransferase [Planctomycetota bacterium]
MLGRFYAIDLFAGCGGLSEGFTRAGFESVAQIEMDKWACETMRTRQLYHTLRKHRLSHLYYNYCRNETTKDDIFNRYPDIAESVNHKVIQREFGKDSPDGVIARIRASMKYHNVKRINVVLGGPPCQSYSEIGRARDPHRMAKDKRHFLFEHYFYILEQLQPDFFVFENVPGLLTARVSSQEMFKKILDGFSSINPAYETSPTFDEYRKNARKYLLNSADFGVPQKRKRLVLIGYKRKLESRYPDIREIFRDILCRGKRNKGCRTVTDAIGDLTELKPGDGSDRWFGSYNRRTNLAEYQNLMRENSSGILNHRARTHMESDLERYKFFIEHHKNGNGAATLKDLKRENPGLMPDHNNLDIFINRFKVQWWNQPSSTVTAHICSDGHYYIHPDIHQCRSFTVREAARCQSFPDNYLFEGPRTEQFRQVGNAVPPLLAEAIAKIIHRKLLQIYG